MPHPQDSRHVGRYEIVDTIARGGMGVVYRAKQPVLDRVAALKRLSVPGDDPAMLARFMRECRLGAQLEHPNIVAVFDYFEHDGVPYLAMEFLARGSLRPWVGRLTSEQVFGVLEGMLGALAHAEAHGVAHRDLKPENVLLTARGGVKIADFGIARAYSNATERLTDTGLAVGTPAYMAPEQVTDDELGPGTDLYALGVMAFELLAGRLPFIDANPAGMVYRHVNEPPPSLAELGADVDPRVAAWVAWLLEKDGGRRPASAVEAWQALEDVVVDLHGPYWRRAAPIAAPADFRDGLPEDVAGAIPGRADARTVAPAVFPGPPDRGSDHPRLVISGPDATIEVIYDAQGSTLRHATRWRRPRRRPRRAPLHPAPARFASHVDRDDELDSLARALETARVVNVVGDRSIGKTHVVVEALHRGEAPRHAVYLDGRGQSAEDLIHALFETFYATSAPVHHPSVVQHLRRRSAMVAIEDVALTADDVRRLVNGAPRCRFVLSSRERVVMDAPAITLGGLAPEHAVVLAEQEIGRALTDDDRGVAQVIATALDGHPLRLRQAFSTARLRDAPLAALREELARPALLQDRLGALSPLELRVARALAVHGDTSLGAEHLESLVDEPELPAVLERLRQRRDVAEHRGRYRLVGALAHALPLSDDLESETSRALAYFTTWLEGQTVDPAAVLHDTPAILALLERAFDTGHPSEAIRLGRAAEGYLSTRQRWAAWGTVLAIVLASARSLEDGVSDGWALNQLGVRSLGRGRTAEAQRLFATAGEVRARAGDTHGAAIARGNLEVLQKVPPPLPRLSHRPAVSVAIMGAAWVAIVVAIVGWMLADPPPSAEERALAATPASITVRLTGSGDGSVHLDGRRLECPARRCRVELREGAAVTLAARPDARSRFVGWQGSDCASGERCRVRVHDGQTISARFVARRPGRALLELAINGHGAVVAGDRRCTSNCSIRVRSGRRVRLDAAPATGWAFAGWTGAGRCGRGTTCRVRARGDMTLRARFVPRPPGSVRLTVTTNGSGRVDIDGRRLSCAAGCSFPAGTEVTLSAHYDQAVRTVDWSADSCNGDTCTLTLVHDTAVTTSFASRAHTLRIRARGGGTVDACGAATTCTRSYAHGARVALMARGARFEGWDGCGRADGRTCRVEVGDDRTVTARFAPGVSLTVRTRGDAEGRVTVAGRSCEQGCTFAAGRRVTALARYQSRTTTLAWAGAACDGRRCTLRLTRDIALTAIFTARRYALTVTTEGDGSVTCHGTCSRRYAHGTRVTLHARPREHAFQEWVGCRPSTSPTCTVVMTAERVITARFAAPSSPTPTPTPTPVPAKVQLTTVADGRGDVTIGGRSCAAGCAFDAGETVTLTASWDPGAVTLTWDAPGCSGATCAVKLDTDTIVTATFATINVEPTDLLRIEDGRVGERRRAPRGLADWRWFPPAPHRTVRAVLPHTAHRRS